MNDNQKQTTSLYNTPDQTHEKAPDKKKRTPKQVAALFCVILLICLYLFTFIIACLDFPGADKLFPVCLMATVGLPILLWIYIWLYGVTKEKHTMASADLLHSDSRTGTRLSQDDPEISETSGSLKASGETASSVSEDENCKRNNDIQ